MTCRECKPIENIADFRVCGNRYFKPEYSEEAPAPTETEIDENGEEGPKCSPTLMTGWIFINPINILVEHMKDKWEVLLKNSKAICVNGGVISIEENPESDAVEKEVLEWIPENIMQLDGSSEQEKKMTERIRKFTGDLKWDQYKIDRIWEECRRLYDEFGVQLDPRMFLAIICTEGTGSFNTDSDNLAADGQNGPEEDFETDLRRALDLVFGKVIAYPYFQKDFSDAREKAYGLPGIPDYNDILHYINWETPRISTIEQNLKCGVYAGANQWNRQVRQIYSEFAFDKAAERYTNYVLNLGTDIFKNALKLYKVDIYSFKVEFEVQEKGQDGEGYKNGEYVIVGNLIITNNKE